MTDLFVKTRVEHQQLQAANLKIDINGLGIYIRLIVCGKDKTGGSPSPKRSFSCSAKSSGRPLGQEGDQYGHGQGSEIHCRLRAREHRCATKRSLPKSCSDGVDTEARTPSLEARKGNLRTSLNDDVSQSSLRPF